MKFIFVIFYFSTLSLNAQILEKKYIKINDKSVLEVINYNNIILKYPIIYGDLIKTKNFLNLEYEIKNDTLNYIEDGINKTFLIKEKMLINYSNQDVFIKEEEYLKRLTLVLFDNEKFYIRFPKTSNGIIVEDYINNDSEVLNNKLKKKLKNINKNKYNVEIIKGFEAIEKYGYEGINGVIVIKKK